MKNLNDEKKYSLNDVWYCTYEKDGKIECVPAFFDYNDVVIDLRNEKQIILDDKKYNKVLGLDENGNEIKPERMPFHISARGFFRDFIKHENVPYGEDLSVVVCAADIFQNVKELPRETILKYLDVAKDAYRDCPPKRPKPEPEFWVYK